MIKQKPLLVLALPSSGSDWFMSCLGVIPMTRATKRKEPFNPILMSDAGYTFQVASNLIPCELHECVKHAFYNFTSSDRTIRAEMMRSIVERDKANIAKDVWMFAQLDDFIMDKFDVVYLMRSTENTFPPARARVFQWYNQLASVSNVTSERDLLQRCMQMHKHCCNIMLENSGTFGVPVIQYEQLTTNSTESVQGYLQERMPYWIDCEKLANVIAQSFIPKRRQ